MQGYEIDKKFFYVEKIINVLRAQNLNKHKHIKIKGRFSDAIVYILSGSCTYTADGKTFTVNKGDILFLAKGSDYTMYIHEDNYRFIFCDLLFSGDEKRVCSFFTPKNTDYAKNLFVKMLSAFNSQENSRLADTLSIFYEIYSCAINSSNNLTASGGAVDKIKNAKNIIDLNFADVNLSISSLSENAGVSEVYFRKAFKLAFGISPAKYVTKVRLEKAKELMAYHFFSLDEISSQCGFLSAQYFCRVFKKNLGVSPAKYRNNN